jgi:pyruvate dehydrogenase E1 component alpha subunit
LVTRELVERARRGEGPAFLLCNTYRYAGHHVGDISREYYRPRQEEQDWKTLRDPIRLHGEWLMSEGLAQKSELDAIEPEVRAEMLAAVEFAMTSPYPPSEDVEKHVYA